MSLDDLRSQVEALRDEWSREVQDAKYGGEARAEIFWGTKVHAANEILDLFDKHEELTTDDGVWTPLTALNELEAACDILDDFQNDPRRSTGSMQWRLFDRALEVARELVKKSEED